MLKLMRPRRQISITTEVADLPFECGFARRENRRLPVQKFSKKVKKKLASFREVQ
jgi:hypothetical protein